jgi:tetratricopeptide (TPR) repeat protein
VWQYLAEYRERDSRKTSLLNQAAGHLCRNKTASNSVLLTWQISFDYICTSRRSATDLLSLMSFFDRQGIQEALLYNPSSTIEEDGFEDNVLILRDYSFITVTKEANTFEMHDLVQLATRTWLGNQSQLDRWRERFISNLCADMPTGQYENWQRCQVLFPHAKAALAQRPQDKNSLEEWARLLYKVAWYASEHMSTVSMEVRQEMFGREHPDTLASMNHLAQVLQRQGKYEEAEAMNRQTLALSETVLGLEHPETLMSMSNLALVLQRQGKYEEAEAMNRQTLALSEMVLGLEHPEMLTSIHCLAYLLAKLCYYHKSLALYERACDGYYLVLGEDHPNTCVCRQDDARLEWTQQHTSVHLHSPAKLGIRSSKR